MSIYRKTGLFSKELLFEINGGLSGQDIAEQITVFQDKYHWIDWIKAIANLVRAEIQCSYELADIKKRDLYENKPVSAG